jgi:hypothetical protein
VVGWPWWQAWEMRAVGGTTTAMNQRLSSEDQVGTIRRICRAMRRHSVVAKDPSHGLELVRRVVAGNLPFRFYLSPALVKPASGTVDLPDLMLAVVSGDIGCWGTPMPSSIKQI